jgi:hypothetical protein
MAHEMVIASRDKDAVDLAERICRLLQVTARYLGIHPLQHPIHPSGSEQ